jgi:hypothetical protein
MYYLVEDELKVIRLQKEYLEFEKKINSAASYNELTSLNQLTNLLMKMKTIPQEVVATILPPRNTETKEVIFSEILVKVVENALADALPENVLNKEDFKICFDGVEKREKTFSFKLIYVTEHIKGRLFYEKDLDMYFTASPDDHFTVKKNGDPTNNQIHSLKSSLRDGAVKSYVKFMDNNAEFTKQYQKRIQTSSIVINIIKTKVSVDAPDKAGATAAPTINKALENEMEQVRCDTNTKSIVPCDTETKSISLEPSGVNVSSDAKYLIAEMAKVKNVLDCLGTAAKVPATVSMDIPLVHAESNTSEFVDGEINLYIYSYLEHIFSFLKPMYEKVKNLKDADERADLLKCFHELFRGALLLKLGVFSEAEAKVSSF